VIAEERFTVDHFNQFMSSQARRYMVLMRFMCLFVE